MSNRRASGRSNIRGPQSALTDFLASHNISAHQITTEYQRRVAEAANQTPLPDEEKENDEPDVDSNGEDAADRKKRKRKEEKALMKIKQSKEFKRRKAQDDISDDDAVARLMMQKSKPLAGQRETCELCEKVFTVTPYSKTGPDGGLLCTPCGKELATEAKKSQAQAKKASQPKARRRQTESDRMMGDVRPGAKSLLECCVKRVADVVNDIEEFGDMPQTLLDRLSQILSKRRVMTARTLELFLQPEGDRIAIYDAAKLDEEDFIKIFKMMPALETVNLRFAGQMKDMALRYMIMANKKIRNLQLGGTNLISNAAWVELFTQMGPQLESLKISELNDSLDDDTVAILASHARNLTRLKLRSCSHITAKSLASIAQISTLTHLSLAVGQDATADQLHALITQLGPNLETLSLENFSEADDEVLSLIHTHCTRLTKLRFTGSYLCSDAAFAALFIRWANPPLSVIDLSDSRDLDASHPDGPPADPIGLGSRAFEAMMSHSGSTLQRLNIHSCRHISRASLLSVFCSSESESEFDFESMSKSMSKSQTKSQTKSKSRTKSDLNPNPIPDPESDQTKTYPSLHEIDVSFVGAVDDTVLTGMFRSCPHLTKVVAFACFNARRVRVPKGSVAVIGLPNATENIVLEG